MYVLYFLYKLRDIQIFFSKQFSPYLQSVLYFTLYPVLSQL
jgi:hypothetical protein